MQERHLGIKSKDFGSCRDTASDFSAIKVVIIDVEIIIAF